MKVIRTVDLDAGGGMDRWVPSTVPAHAAAAWRDAEGEGCAFDGCTAGWAKLWRRRGRPLFEGEWGCSRTCMRGLVTACVRREMEGADGAADTHLHQHRVPLGLMLMAQGLVTETQLKRALEEQRRAGRGRIGEWLVESYGVLQEDVTRGLGMQWQCPVLGVAGFDPRAMALTMPSSLRELCGVLPLRVAGGRILYVAFDEAVDAGAAFALERMSGLNVESGVLQGGAFAQALARLSRCDAVSCREADVSDMDELVEKVVELLFKLQPVASRLVRLRDRYWLRVWLERGAIGKDGMLPATGEDVVDVVYRIDGSRSGGKVS